MSDIVGVREGTKYEVHVVEPERWKWTTCGIESASGQPDRYSVEFRLPDGSIRRLYFKTLEIQERVIAQPHVWVTTRRYLDDIVRAADRSA